MKFTADLQDISEALQFVVGVIERKLTYPILSNVLIDAGSDGTVRLRSTDLDLSLVARFEASSVSEPGMTTVPGRRALDVVGSITSGGSFELETTDKGAQLQCGRSQFVLSTMESGDFPPEVQLVDEVSVPMPAGMLLHLLRAASSSMAQNDIRRHLNGALIEVTSSHVRSVATDGMVLCMCTNNEIQIETDSVIQALLPRKAVLELVRGFSGEEGTLTMSIGTNAVSVKSDNLTLTTNLIDKPFPAYMRVVPEESDKVLNCDRESLLRGITQAATLSDEGLKVFLNADRDLMTITANTEVGDRAEVKVPVDFGDNSTNVIFRHDRLRSVLGTFDSEDVCFHIPSPTEAVRVDSKTQSDIVFVVSPIRG